MYMMSHGRSSYFSSRPETFFKLFFSTINCSIRAFISNDAWVNNCRYPSSLTQTVRLNNHILGSAGILLLKYKCHYNAIHVEYPYIMSQTTYSSPFLLPEMYVTAIKINFFILDFLYTIYIFYTVHLSNYLFINNFDSLCVEKVPSVYL